MRHLELRRQLMDAALLPLLKVMDQYRVLDVADHKRENGQREMPVATHQLIHEQRTGPKQAHLLLPVHQTDIINVLMPIPARLAPEPELPLQVAVVAQQLVSAIRR